MKRFFLVLVFLVLVFCSCDKNNGGGKDVSPQEEISEEKEKKIPVLMAGERDEFHPKSRFESIRKSKITNMGMRTSPPPVLTPDKLAVNKSIYNPNYTSFFASFFDSKKLVIPSYPFDYENNLQILKRLYNSHHLDEILNNEMSELEMLTALMTYTYNFMEGGSEPTSDTDRGPSAEIITKLRREKGIGGTSKHYSALFCQLALSCGFNSRMIGMHTIDDNGKLLTHNVCEVFMNSFDKWTVFDVFERATYYVRDDIPQSALELHNIMLNKNYRILNVFSEFEDFSDVISVREKLLPRYKYIYMWRMNDILSKSPRNDTIPWQALYQHHLVWEDKYAPVAEGDFDKLESFNNMDNPDYPLDGVHFVTHNMDDFNWPLNHVTINVERKGEADYFIYLDTMTPNFETFEIFNVSNTLQTDYTFKMNEPLIDFVVRSINVFGKHGPISKLSLSR